MKSSSRQFVRLHVPESSGAGTFQLGLSLIELMISITIGLLILVALTSLFVNQSRARVELDKSNRMIDNGSYALQVLSDDIRQAGYYGEFIPTSGNPLPPSGSLPDPCSVTAADISNANSPPPTAPTGAFVLQLAVQGYDAATQTSTPAFSAACQAILTANSETLNPGSDILVVRRTSTQSLAGAVNNVLYLQASACQYDSKAFVIDNTPANFTLRQLTCTVGSGAPYANVRQFMVDIYFVSKNDKVTNGVGDAIPTLKRIEIDPNTQAFVVTPLVEGIEYMQVDYGVDSSGDGTADTFTPTPALTEWPEVVAVKMHLLARNTDSTYSYTDSKKYNLGQFTVSPGGHYKRHAYDQYIRVVNVAGRRRP